MPNILKLTKIGNPVLRKTAKRLSRQEITSDAIQALIVDMRYTIASQESGVALAATQVGEGVALSIIGIKPTPNRPELEPFEKVIINPEIIEVYGKLEPKWEACISCGSGDDLLFAQVPRYRKVKLRWQDETGKQHEEILEGFVAHVVQHETDHLNGIMFVDKVENPLSYMTADEYRKRVVSKKFKEFT